MKESTKKSPVLEALTDWWDWLSPGQKAATVWLSVVAVILLIVGITFPLAGMIMLGVAALFGTIASILTFLE